MSRGGSQSLPVSALLLQLIKCMVEAKLNVGALHVYVTIFLDSPTVFERLGVRSVPTARVGVMRELWFTLIS